MQTSFKLSTNNLIKLTQWVREHKSVRYIHNPIKVCSGVWEVTLNIESTSDINSFNEFWNIIQLKEQKKKINKKSIGSQIGMYIDNIMRIIKEGIEELL